LIGVGAHLSEQDRRHLLAFLSEDHPDARRWMERLRKLRTEVEISAFAEVVRLLVNLVVSESEGERLLGRISEHRESMKRALQRDPGLRVAAVDYLSNVETRLTNPKIVEMSLFEKTLQSAVTDPLTGKFNRRHFHQNLEREIARSRRHGLVFSIVLLDLDDFKRVNDDHGHMVGDLVLKKAARVFTRSVRDVDVICRLGGDEFVVHLPETDRMGAFVVAERIRRRVAEEFAERPTGGKDIRLSLSGGIAVYPEDGRDRNGLLERADASLYEAKRTGRNRVTLFHSEKREAVRYPVRRTTRIRISTTGNEVGWPARGVNLSRVGALLETSGDLRPTDEVRILFGGARREAGKATWEVAGTVVRVEETTDRSDLRRLAIRFEAPVSDESLVGQVIGAGHAAGA
jgi:diguanylate cyclase (GGDEF)-like protein